MGERNEPRGRRWARWLLVACVAAVVVQVAGWVLLDGVAEMVVVWAPWPAVALGMIATVPVGRPGLPTPPPTLTQSFAPAFPSVVSFVPIVSNGSDADETFVWFLVGMGVLTVVALVVAWLRPRRYRRAPVPLVELRVVDDVS